MKTSTGRSRVALAGTAALMALGLSGCGSSSDHTNSTSQTVKASSASATSSAPQTSPRTTAAPTQPRVTITRTATQSAAAPAPQRAAATFIPTPDIPAGWKSCGRTVINNTSMPIMAESATTSCDFAVNTVQAAETAQSMNINPYSPALGRTVPMTCDIADGGGTCGGGNSASVSWVDSLVQGAG